MTIEQFQSRLGFNIPGDVLNEKFVEFKKWAFEENLKSSVDEIFSELARSYAREIRIKQKIEELRKCD